MTKTETPAPQTKVSASGTCGNQQNARERDNDSPDPAEHRCQSGRIRTVGGRRTVADVLKDGRGDKRQSEDPKRPLLHVAPDNELQRHNMAGAMDQSKSTPAPQPNLRVVDLTNEQKEITLLRIIDAMGGETDSSDYPYSWLTWFCSDEIHNVQDDTFNRCNEKGWLHTTHNTDMDTSTTTLTAAGRAALATTEGSDNGN